MSRIARIAGVCLVVAAILWGIRVTALEGFIYAWPRGFAGDFSSAMYDPDWWDGNGIIYGPLFVVQRWLVNVWPGVFTVYTFALFNLVLSAGAFIFGLKACRCSVPVSLVALASWVCFWRLSYSYSVAANPEFLELFFLCAAWFAASRQRERSEGVLVAAAGLTKLIPWVFVAMLYARRAWRAFGPLVCTAVVVVLLVGLGQRMSLWNIATQTIVPFGGRTPSFQATTYSSQFLGMPEVLTWAVYGDVQLLSYQQNQVLRLLFLASAAIAFGVTMLTSVLLSRRARPRRGLALMYATFIALIPVLTPQVHNHTFLFLLPAWIVLADALWTDWVDGRGSMAAMWAVLVGACYAVTGFPIALRIADRALGTALTAGYSTYLPMTGNLILLAVLWSYSLTLTQTDAMLAPDRQAAIP